MPRHPGERRQLEIPPHCLASNATELRSHKVSCESSHEMGNWPSSSGRLAATPLQTRFTHSPYWRLRPIDTRFDSHSSRYVKSFVRGFRFGIAAARSSCPKLRMLSATMNRVPPSIWDKRHGLHQRPADMVGRGPQSATRYSTAGGWPVCPAGRVYPRACGGTREACTGRIQQCGLSPRVRGNRPAVCM